MSGRGSLCDWDLHVECGYENWCTGFWHAGIYARHPNDGQMGRFYKLPIRSSGVCAANVPDGQAMWETSNSLWAAVQSGTNVVYHAAGWLEGGLIASRKFIMDCEVLQMIQRYFEPIITRTDPEDIALDAIREVGSSGHFFGVQHTQDRYEHAFHQPFISDWRNYEGWDLGWWCLDC